MAATPQHAARVLGLSLEASIDDVKQVRRKMALKHHPDCSKDQAQSTRHMARINAAADTLIAHIKKQARPEQKHKRPNFADFATRKKPSPAAARPNATRDEARKRKTRPQAQQPGTRVIKKKTASPADTALIRFATRSYTTVLDRISRKDTGATIDVNILAF